MNVLTVIIPLLFGVFFMWIYLKARVKKLNGLGGSYKLPPLFGKK